MKNINEKHILLLIPNGCLGCYYYYYLLVIIITLVITFDGVCWGVPLFLINNRIEVFIHELKVTISV